MVSDPLTCSLFGNIAMTMCFKSMLEGQFKHLTAVRVKTDHIFFSESSMRENLHILPVFYCHLHSLGMWAWRLSKRWLVYFTLRAWHREGECEGKENKGGISIKPIGIFLFSSLYAGTLIFFLIFLSLNSISSYCPGTCNLKMFCATLWTWSPDFISGKDSKRMKRTRYKMQCGHSHCWNNKWSFILKLFLSL